MNPRFKELRKYLSLSQIQFARRINMSPGFVSNVENGRCNLSEDTISTVCSTFGVNKEWLLTGNGNMFTSGNEKPSADKNGVGDRVRKVRKDNHLTQTQFAEKIGYSAGQVRAVEYHTVRPSNDCLLSVAGVFNVSYNWLLTGEEGEAEEVELDESLLAWLRRNPDVVNELKLRARIPQPKERDEQQV